MIALACLASYWCTPEDDGVALATQFHVALWDGNIRFYNEAWPYRGSIIQIDGEPPLLRRNAFDFPGVYYRYFQFPTHVTWSIKLSLWYPIVLTIVVNAGMLRRVRNNILSILSKKSQ